MSTLKEVRNGIDKTINVFQTSNNKLINNLSLSVNGQQISSKTRPADYINARSIFSRKATDC